HLVAHRPIVAEIPPSLAALLQFRRGIGTIAGKAVMFDVAIIGSGFGGSLLSMIFRQQGRSVLLLEKGTHPRFVIGESSTPMADLLWRDLTTECGLPQLSPFAKWGTWRRHHPEVACGLKRGFTFYHHRFGEPFSAAADRSDQLLMAASPRDEIADTHWYRPDF